MGLFGNQDIGIDLGTASVLVYVKNKGIVLNEPSVLAMDTETGKILAVGEEARRMIGRTPERIAAIRPLRDGVISDYDVTERMLRYFLRKVIGRRALIRPRVVVCIPAGVTEVERRSVIDATVEAGARDTYLIEEPLAAAIGAGMDISQPNGNMVVDIGGGTTDIALISLSSMVAAQTIKIAGDRFDEAIVRYMRRAHNLLIGERTAEDVKKNIGCAFPRRENIFMDVTGRNLMTGLPDTIKVGSNEMLTALEEPLNGITEAVCQVLERTPPELAADVRRRGIVMTGGGSMLYGLERLISERANVPCYLAEDAISCVAIGTGRALESIEIFGQNLVSGRDHLKRRYRDKADLEI